MIRFVPPRLLLVITISLLCCCANQRQQKSVPPKVELQKEEKALDSSLAELKRLYEAAQSQYERRAVSLRAIDEGAIKPGQSISSVDAIFGTHVASRLPLVKGGRDFD